MEAMACGTPVLASEIGGLPEVLDAGRAGYLVPLTASALAHRLRGLHAEPEIPPTLVSAMARQVAKFSPENMLSTLNHTLADLAVPR